MFSSMLQDSLNLCPNNKKPVLEIAPSQKACSCITLLILILLIIKGKMRIMLVQVCSKKQINITSKIAYEIWCDHYYPILGKSQIDYMLDKFQSPEAISEQISAKNYSYYLIQHNKEFIGYIALQAQEKALFISKFYIKKIFRGNGHGREAMNFIIEQSKKLDLNKIFLTVNKYNTDSMRVYEKLGFTQTEPIVQDIGRGFVMDDYKYEISI